MRNGNKNENDTDCKDQDYFVIDRAAFNQGVNAQYDIIIQRGGHCQR